MKTEKEKAKYYINIRQCRELIKAHRKRDRKLIARQIFEDLEKMRNKTKDTYVVIWWGDFKQLKKKWLE